MMDSTFKQRFAVIAAAIVGGAVVYFVVGAPKGTPAPEPFRGALVSVGQSQSDAPGESDRPTVMSAEMHSAIRDRVREAISNSGAPSTEAASHATTEFASFVADFDIDRMLALAIGTNAIPHAETVSQFRMMLNGFPENRKPDGWKSFNDLQILRWGYGISGMARWESVILDTISARYFPAGPETKEFAAFWRMNPPDGYEFSGEATAVFEIPDLRRKARMGEVASLLVSFAVQIRRGDLWLITLHLAEHQPGAWYPVAYRNDSAKSVDPFPSNRAPRPN